MWVVGGCSLLSAMVHVGYTQVNTFNGCEELCKEGEERCGEKEEK